MKSPTTNKGAPVGSIICCWMFLVVASCRNNGENSVDYESYFYDGLIVAPFVVPLGAKPMSVHSASVFALDIASVTADGARIQPTPADPLYYDENWTVVQRRHAVVFPVRLIEDSTMSGILRLVACSNLSDQGATYVHYQIPKGAKAILFTYRLRSPSGNGPSDTWTLLMKHSDGLAFEDAASSNN